MSNTMIRIEDSDKFEARECGNHRREDLPVDDSTELSIELGALASAPWLHLSIGKWRELVAQVEAGIAAIPAERAAWHAREAEYKARHAQAVGDVMALQS